MTTHQPPAGEQGASMRAQIEAVVLRSGRDVEKFWPWAAKRCHRVTQEELTMANLTDLLSYVRQHIPPKDQEKPAEPVDAQEPADTASPLAQDDVLRSRLTELTADLYSLVDDQLDAALRDEAQEAITRATAIAEDAATTQPVAESWLRTLEALNDRIAHALLDT